MIPDNDAEIPKTSARNLWPRRWAALALASMIGLTWSGLGHALQESKVEPAATDPALELVKSELKIALESLERIAKMRQIGAPVNLSVAEAYGWSRRVLEARLYLSLGLDAKTEDVEVYLTNARGKPSGERIAFFEEHLSRMVYLEGQNRILQENLQISDIAFANVIFYRRQAEVWLAREKGRREFVKS